jgi:hypothetical protein
LAILALAVLSVVARVIAAAVPSFHFYPDDIFNYMIINDFIFIS